MPARSGSKGLPGKNIKYLSGKPLLAYPIEAAIGCDYIDNVVISTDSLEYASIAEKYGAQFHSLRPDRFARDDSLRAELILHELSIHKDYEYIVYLEPTSPLTTSQDISDALEALVANVKASSLVSIALQHVYHPSYAVKCDENSILTPNSYETFSDVPINRQSLENIYYFDGSLYISEVKAFLRHKEFLHNSTMGYIMPHEKSLEIDNEADFLLAEVLLNG